MLTFPLTKYDKTVLKEFEQFIANKKKDSFYISDNDYDKYSEIIQLMKQQGYITLVEDGYGIYIDRCSIDNFKQWLINEDKKSRISGRREWKIAIVTGLLSAIVSIITTLITLKIKG